MSEEMKVFSASDEWKNKLIDAARWAPSADNHVPWSFEWDPQSRLILRNIPERSGKAADRTYILTNLALGAAVENVILQARTKHLYTTIRYEQISASEIKITLTFDSEKGERKDYFQELLVHQIFKRSTNRSFPFRGSLSKDEIDLMVDCSTTDEQTTFILTDKKEIKKLLPAMQRAEGIRFQAELLHQELFSSVNFREANSEGMTMDMLGIEIFMKPFFKALRNWEIMRRLNTIGVHKVIAYRSVTIPIKLSPGLAVMSSKTDSYKDVFMCGRQMQRFWLMAAHLGIDVHPYAAPGILTLAEPEVDEKFKTELKNIKSELDKLAPSNQNVVMMFRIGKTNVKTMRTQRKSIESHAFGFQE